MKVSRRDFLKLGGAVVIVAAGGSVFRAAEQGVFSSGQGPAYEPWKNWRAATLPTERIVAAGILAANPHNSQPWIFRINSASIDLFAVPERQIGAIDPLRREMYIGLGCALENMKLAAAAEGLPADIRLMPDPANGLHAAHLSLASALPQRAGLYAAIPDRHTNRSAYDTTSPVAEEILNAIDALIQEDDVRLFWLKDQAARDRFGRVAVDAAGALIADDQQSIDSHRWWRQDWSQLQESEDGITPGCTGIGPGTHAAGQIPARPFAPAERPDLCKQRGRDHGRDCVRIRDPGRPGWYGSCPTPAVRTGLAAHSFVGHNARLGPAAAQPDRERADRERQLGITPVFGGVVSALIGDGHWQAVMPFRLGYPTVPGLPSPRRGLDKVIG